MAAPKKPQGPHAGIAGYEKLTPEQQQARNRRNIAMIVALLGFVLLVFLITVARLQGGIPDRM